MTDRLINGVPADRYGVWCRHDKHILVADPADTSGYPACIPADPWPCDECTFEEFSAAMEAEALEAEEALWREWHDSQ